jgi:hypothetical protein
MSLRDPDFVRATLRSCSCFEHSNMFRISKFRFRDSDFKFNSVTQIQVLNSFSKNKLSA